eukprot:5474429-Lingulodinium_polyedra.AAC.1
MEGIGHIGAEEPEPGGPGRPGEVYGVLNQISEPREDDALALTGGGVDPGAEEIPDDAVFPGAV